MTTDRDIFETLADMPEMAQAVAGHDLFLPGEEPDRDVQGLMILCAGRAILQVAAAARAALDAGHEPRLSTLSGVPEGFSDAEAARIARGLAALQGLVIDAGIRVAATLGAGDIALLDSCAHGLLLATEERLAAAAGG